MQDTDKLPYSVLQKYIHGDISNLIVAEKQINVDSLIGLIPSWHVGSSVVDVFLQIYIDHIYDLLKQIELDGHYMTDHSFLPGYRMIISTMYYGNSISNNTSSKVPKLVFNHAAGTATLTT